MIYGKRSKEGKSNKYKSADCKTVKIMIILRYIH